MAKQPPLLTGVNLVVRDMAATLAFYRCLGLLIPDDAVWPAGGSAHHVEVKEAGGPSLGLDSVAMTKGYDPGWQAPSGPSRNVIMFSLPSRAAVDELYEHLTAAGHRGHLAPIDGFWGARYAVVYDPDGNQVGLMSPTDDEHRGSPPPL